MTKTEGREVPESVGELQSYGVVDLTPASAPAAVTGRSDAAVAAEPGRKPERGENWMATPSIVFKTPVPLWKARDILLEAVTGASLEFFQARAAVSSRDRGKGQKVNTNRPVGDSTRADGDSDVHISAESGAGGESDGAEDHDGEDGFERVFSMRLEVWMCHLSIIPRAVQEGGEIALDPEGS